MKKGKLLVLILMLLCLSSAILIGCSDSSTLIGDDYKQAGYSKVTFYYNGGLVSGASYIEYFISTGGRLPLPQQFKENPIIIIPNKSGYEFYGWYAVKPEAYKVREELMYEPTLNENDEKIPVYNTKGEHATRKVPYIQRGNQIFDENNLISLKEFEEEQEPDYTGEKIFIKEWNFDFDKVTDDLILVAIWQPQRFFIIIPPENKNDDFNSEGYQSKYIFNVNANGSISLPVSTLLPKKPGWQIEGYYLDRACTIKVPFDSKNRFYPDFEFDEKAGKFKIFPIYIKWLDEKFRIVTSANTLANMLEYGNYYIANDLDFKNVNNFKPPAVFRGEIRGNNHVWRNLKITINQTKSSDVYNNSNYGGIFGELVGAKIRDIVIENLNITFIRINPNIVGNDPSFWSLQVNFHLFAKSIDSRSLIRNVRIGNKENSLEKSTFSIVEYSAFTRMQQVVLDKNGYPYRWAEPNEQGHFYVEADEQGNYPEEGSIYNGSVLKYQRNYTGDYIYYTTAAADPLDSRILFGNILYLAPSYTPSLKVYQNGNNFGLNLDNIVNCEADIEIINTEIPWMINYKPNDPKPNPLNADEYTAGSDFSGMDFEFAGWYTEDFIKWDFNIQNTEPVTLIAMWKRKL